MIYKCRHFKIEELVPIAIARDYKAKAWMFLDDKALRTLDMLRSHFGKIIVNDYVWEGHNQFRGLRPANCLIGATMSQHRFGRAFDCIFKEANIDNVRAYILDNPNEFPYINALEMDVSWLHFDTRNCERIMKFYPKKV